MVAETSRPMLNLDRQNMSGFVRFSTVMTKDIITSFDKLPLVGMVENVSTTSLHTVLLLPLLAMVRISLRKL